MFVTSQTSLLDQLAAVIASVLTGAASAPSKVKLATGSFAPSPTSDPATFTEANFDGYAAENVTSWQTPYLNAAGQAESLGGLILHWAPTGSTTPNIVTGYWLVGGNGHYMGGEAFASPVPMGSPLNALNLVVLWQTAPAGWTSIILP